MVQDGQLVGIVTETDLLDFLIDLLEKETAVGTIGRLGVYCYSLRYTCDASQVLS